MEYLEAQFLTACACKLLEIAEITSLVWLHDGFWFSPACSNDCITIAVKHASETSNIGIPSVHVVDLYADWCAEFEGTSCASHPLNRTRQVQVHKHLFGKRKMNHKKPTDLERDVSPPKLVKPKHSNSSHSTQTNLIFKYLVRKGVLKET